MFTGKPIKRDPLQSSSEAIKLKEEISSYNTIEKSLLKGVPLKSL